MNPARADLALFREAPDALGDAETKERGDDLPCLIRSQRNSSDGQRWRREQTGRRLDNSASNQIHKVAHSLRRLPDYEDGNDFAAGLLSLDKVAIEVHLGHSGFRRRRSLALDNEDLVACYGNEVSP